MQVLLAEEYGFCFGVERAVEMVEGALSEGATVRTLGPLIHNTQEIQRLEADGVRTIDAPDDVSEGETAVIPSGPVLRRRSCAAESAYLSPSVMLLRCPDDSCGLVWPGGSATCRSGRRRRFSSTSHLASSARTGSRKRACATRRIGATSTR